MRVLFLTGRGVRHQSEAIAAAPPGVELVMLRDGVADEDAVVALARDVEAIVSERDRPVTRRVIASAPKLRMILRLGSLAQGIDLAAARERGIPVVVRPVRVAIAAAEHVVMMSLAVLRRLGRSFARTALPVEASASASAESAVGPRRTDEDTFAYNWNHFADLASLYESTVLILGMGEIGVETARRLRPFAPREVSYWKRRRYAPELETELGITHVADREAAIARAGVVISLLPYSAETRASIGREVFARMKRSAVLVSAGSGGVLDEEALVRALEERRIAGAAVDTFELEPMRSDHALVRLARDPDANLLLTPHVASGSLPAGRHEDFQDLARLLSESA